MSDYDINKIYILNEEVSTVGDYLEILLSTEGRFPKNHEKIQDASEILKKLSPEIFHKPSTNFNLAAFLLDIYQKDKKIAQYYISLIQKYSLTDSKLSNSSNVFAVVESLLKEANLIIHPDNEVEKYFSGGNYSFAVGIKVESFYKYIPDKSLQEQIQNVMRLRVAFLMTLLEFRTEDYGDLKDIYLNKGLYSREISLCILFHTIVSLVDDPNRDYIQIYYEVKEKVKDDLKNGILQLPDRRLFHIKSLLKRRTAEHEFKKYFINEKDFTQNNSLRIITAYVQNFRKISEQVFPVVAVKDPISGKIIRIRLTKYGAETEELKEVEIPKIHILNDDIAEYIRIQLAKRLADSKDKSIEEIVREVLKEKNLDSDSTVRNIADLIRPSLFEADSWGRKLLFWMSDYNPQKTIIGNLIALLLSKSNFSSLTKEKIEKYTNINGFTLITFGLGLGFAGLPGAIVLGGLSAGISVIAKRESMETTIGKAFLKGYLGYSKEEIEKMSSGRQNPYYSLLDNIVNGNKSSINNFYRMLSHEDASKPKALTSLNYFGARRAGNIQNAFNYSLGILGLFGASVGIHTSYTNSMIRRSRENIEMIKNMSGSSLNATKKFEAMSLLSLIIGNPKVFGYSRALIGGAMYKAVTLTSPKGHVFFNFVQSLIAPKYNKAPGESFAYSLTGRFVQKSTYRIGQALGLISKRNGPAFLASLINNAGRISGKLSNSLLNYGGNSLNRTTRATVAVGGGIALTGFLMMMQFSPIILANKTANTPGGIGGGDVNIKTETGPFLLTINKESFNGTSSPINISYRINLSKIQGNNYDYTKISNVALIALVFSGDTVQLNPQFVTTGWQGGKSINPLEPFNEVVGIAVDPNYRNIVGVGQFCSTALLTYTESGAAKSLDANICLGKDGNVIGPTYVCPFPTAATIFCTQGFVGGASDFHKQRLSADLVPSVLPIKNPYGDNTFQPISPTNGTVSRILQNSCAGDAWGGEWVEITGQDNKIYSFLHLIKPLVTVGQQVKGGQPIAQYIFTRSDIIPGRSPIDTNCWTGLHLHVDVYDISTTPASWVPSYNHYKNVLKCNMSNSC